MSSTVQLSPRASDVHQVERRTIIQGVRAMKKVIVIAGATATGKSSFGLRLAHALNTEIISCDSIQVYRDLNIGSAKLSRAEMEGVEHHCINTRNLDEGYSVYDFQQEARAAIEKIHAEGKIPILVGGTGLYLKAVLYDYDFDREEMKILQSDEDNATLYAKLIELDPVSAGTIHVNNRKRILRALEIAESGETKSQREAKQEKKTIYDVTMVVMDIPNAVLEQRISERIQNMIENGWVEEVKRCFSHPATWTYQSFQGIGYKEWKEYLQANASLEETLLSIRIHTRQFAKRQRTWFRHQSDATWVNALDPAALDKTAENIITWAKQEVEV
ncbi:MAG: tRNA (adenosine(37)-N6)-dimethylallyltransferase MiaA [Erysipelotrichales bacterium]|nr:MAG: tRNA (adenosine(37)-N6)-dimethylallyltransferase MiaA [Erysipelotrichales bacterium]